MSDIVNIYYPNLSEDTDSRWGNIKNIKIESNIKTELISSIANDLFH